MNSRISSFTLIIFIEESLVKNAFNFIDNKTLNNDLLNDIKKITQNFETPPNKRKSKRNSIETNQIPKEFEWNPPMGRKIPSLNFSVLHNNSYRPITANSSQPIPFTTDIFTGKVLFMLNTHTKGELYQSRFDGTKYTFEVNIILRSLCNCCVSAVCMADFI